MEAPPAHHYAFYIDQLFRWLEHAGLVRPSLVEVRLTLSAGDRGFADLRLPPRTACVERCFEVYFPTPMGLRYGWMVDSTSEWTVPMHYFIPNSGYVEQNIFGRYWVKWHFLRFHYEALDRGTVTIRAWARLMDHESLERFIRLASPLADMFGVSFPYYRQAAPATGSELVRACRACGARLYRLPDGRLARKGEWGRSYTDHDCEVFR